MNPTEMPAYRQIKSSIWNSFRNSGKRHLILTGQRGSGKTTLLSQLFPEVLPGITTWAKPYEAVFMKENGTEKTIQIAQYDASITGTEAKMVLIDDAMAVWGTEILNRCAVSNCEWITIDEVGFLEEGCEPYKQALRRLLEQKQVIAVVRKQELPFLNELRSRNDVFVIDLDEPYGENGSRM